MLTAVINNEFTLVLPPGLKIKMSNKSPVFYPQDGNLSYPFKLDGKSTINRNALNFINNPNRFPLQTEENDIQIFSDNDLIVNGTIKTTESTDGSFNNYIKAGQGEFNSIVTGVMMPDIDFGGIRTIGTDETTALATYTAVASLAYPDSDYAVFPYTNTNFFDGFSSFEATWKLNSVVNWWKDATFKSAKSNSPFPYLNYVLKQIFETNGYSIAKNYFNEDDELKTLVVFNMNGANNWNYSGGAWQLWTYFKINLANHVPNISVNSFLSSLEKRFNVSIHIDELTKEVRIINNESLLTKITSKDYSQYFNRGVKWSNELSTGFLLKSNQDGNDSYANFKDFSNVTKQSPVGTKSLLPAFGNTALDVRWVLDENVYYIWNGGDDTLSAYSWQYYANFWPVGVGDESITKDSDMDTLAMYKGPKIHSGDPLTEWLTPRADQVGNIIEVDQWQGHEFTARLLFYRGLYEDEDTNDYPLGSSDVYDYASNIIGDRSLTYHGQYGLYEKNWKAWFYHRMNYGKFGTVNGRVPNHIITELKYYNKERFNDFDFIPTEKDYTISNRGVSDLQLKFYKI